MLAVSLFEHDCPGYAHWMHAALVAETNSSSMWSWAPVTPLFQEIIPLWPQSLGIIMRLHRQEKESPLSLRNCGSDGMAGRPRVYAVYLKSVLLERRHGVLSVVEEMWASVGVWTSCASCRRDAR